MNFEGNFGVRMRNRAVILKDTQNLFFFFIEFAALKLVRYHIFTVIPGRLRNLRQNSDTDQYRVKLDRKYITVCYLPNILLFFDIYPPFFAKLTTGTRGNWSSFESSNISRLNPS